MFFLAPALRDVRAAFLAALLGERQLEIFQQRRWQRRPRGSVWQRRHVADAASICESAFICRSGRPSPVVTKKPVVRTCAFWVASHAGRKAPIDGAISLTPLRLAPPMTPFRRRMTPATKRMAEDMLVRNMALRTIDSYTYHVDRFAKHFGKLPEDLGPEQIREFQLWMIQVKKSSWSQFNQAVCALRFLYTVTIPRPWVVQMIPFGKRPKKLPTVLGQEEVHD